MGQDLSLLTERWFQQDSRCIWCGCLTWRRGMMSKDEGRAFLGIPKGAPNTKAQLRLQLATREHIIPRSVMPSVGSYNVVCACNECNSKRGSHMTKVTPRPEVAILLPTKVQEHLARVTIPLPLKRAIALA